MEPVYLWHGERPGGRELEERVRQALGITRAAGFRRVRDPWGNFVDLELGRVLTHIGHHPTDRRRWELIPAIVPAIKHANTLYESGSRHKYEARLRVYSRTSGHYERVVFVATVIVVGSRRVFDSVVAPTKERDIVAQRETAGRATQARRNPFWPAPAPEALAGSRRTPERSSGAASARFSNDTTARKIKARAVDLLAAILS